MIYFKKLKAVFQCCRLEDDRTSKFGKYVYHVMKLRQEMFVLLRGYGDQRQTFQQLKHLVS